MIRLKAAYRDGSRSAWAAVNVVGQTGCRSDVEDACLLRIECVYEP